MFFYKVPTTKMCEATHDSHTNDLPKTASTTKMVEVYATDFSMFILNVYIPNACTDTVRLS